MMRVAAMAIFLLATCELGLRLWRLRKGTSKQASSRDTPSRVLSFVSHPYALYVKKPNGDGLYPSNSLGYVGKQEFLKERTPGSVRIYCVGDSITEGFDPERGPSSSWPALLQSMLMTRFPGTLIECINAGTSGYTSAESLSEFMFRGLDLKPDILLVYHNVNDACTCQMVEGFTSDYSHARRHKPFTVRWISRVPELPFLISYQAVRHWVTRRFGKANALIFWLSDPPWKTARTFNPEAVRVFARNITNLVQVAQAWGSIPVLIKWECDWSARWVSKYLVGDEETPELYYRYLRENNQALEQIAHTQPGCHYLDVGPFKPEAFFDTMHFTPTGLDEMASRVADRVEPLVRRLLEGLQASSVTGVHEAAPARCESHG